MRDGLNLRRICLLWALIIGAFASCDGRAVSSSDDASTPADGSAVVDADGHTDGASGEDSAVDSTVDSAVGCGDGVANGAEVCDGADLAGTTCADLPGFGAGNLTCLVDCSGFDTAACIPAGPICGNDVIDPGEVCDGTDLAGMDCTDFGYPEGDLWCAGNCSGYLLHACLPPLPGTCGDGILDEWWCDGNQFGGDDCLTLGFTGGTLGCTAGCHYDPSGCIGDACATRGLYGNGYCDPCPLMGGTEDPDCALCGVADGICASMLHPRMGIDGCSVMTGLPDPDCGVCGDGVADLYEYCDGIDLGANAGPQLTCLDLGFSGGTLACDANCIFDTSGCVP